MFVYFQNIHSHQLINTKRTGTTDILRLTPHAPGLADGQVLGGRCDIGPLEHRHCGCPMPPPDYKSPQDPWPPQAWHPGGSLKACCRSGHRSEAGQQAYSCTGHATCRILASHLSSCTSQPFLINYPSPIKEPFQTLLFLITTCPHEILILQIYLLNVL